MVSIKDDKANDYKFMKLALRLAKKAEGMTNPNPLVGAVIVKDGKIIGKGYHKKAGLPHAEIEAIKDAKKAGHSVFSSTLYVNLEPCCHTNKKTPPCTESIIRERIGRVVVGTKDPNPFVSGKGIEILRSAGIKVDIGLLEKECQRLNEVFFKHIVSRFPFVILKMASSLDGKIATVTGDSKWIGSEKQRYYAHKMRSVVDGVLVGINTVISDDPMLNVRLVRSAKKQPIPIIVDSKLRIPIDASIFKVHKKPVIATTFLADKNKVECLKDKSRLIIVGRGEDGGVDLKELLGKLYEIGICSVMVEGGRAVATSMLKQRLVDKIVIFYAPLMVGSDGLDMVDLLGVKKIEESLKLHDIKTKKFGEEFVVEGYL